MFFQRTLATLGLAALLTGGALAAPTELRIGLPSEPQSLDLTGDGDVAAIRAMYGNVFEALVRLDDQGNPQPWLAERWELAPDGLSLTLSVRPGVHFHDGTSFDADDAAFSLNRQLGKLPAFSAIAGVSVSDARTLRIVLAHPDAELLSALAGAAAVMVASESADNNGTEPIGTGPFALFDWFQGDRMILERNETYWGEHPEIVKASLVVYADSAAGVAALQRGDVDGLAHVADSAALAKLEGLPGVFVAGDGAWKVGIEGVPVEMAEDWLDLRVLQWGE